MSSVLSHIVQKRLSRENEDVATEALAYILASSQTARGAMGSILQGVESEVPNLWFETQTSDAGIRPDMWGLDAGVPRAFIENKFWAGLTDAQPVEYLRRLGANGHPSVLLVVAPEARQRALARELHQRMQEQGVTVEERQTGSGLTVCGVTDIGPAIGLTSWSHVLSLLAHRLSDEPRLRGDVEQLRELCDAAEEQAFAPVSAEELGDQRMPAFVLHMNSLVQEMVQGAASEGVVSIENVRPQSSWEWIGRYLYANTAQSVGAWVGLHFALWRRHGCTPLWLLFSKDGGGPFTRGEEIRRLLEPWAVAEGLLTADTRASFGIALEIPPHEEKDRVVRSLTYQLKRICMQLRDI